MGVATRALFTGSTPAPPGILSLTSAPDGGWPGMTGAMHQDGVTVFGYVDGSGNVEARTYTHATGVVSAAGTLHATLEVDHHDSPALYIRSDGRIVAVYCKHDAANGALYRRISTNPLDVSAWDAEGDIDSSVGGYAYTYPRIVGVGDTLYLFARDIDAAGVVTLIMSTSADGGATWSAHTDIWDTGTTGHYWRAETNGSRIDIVASDGSAAEDGGSLYHFYLEDGTWHKTNGDAMGSPPFGPEDATLVYDGAAGGVRLPYDIVWPSVAWVSYAGGGLYDYGYARWSGSAWVTSYLDESVAGFSTWESGVALHPTLPGSWAYVARDDGGTSHLFRYRSLDGGATWPYQIRITASVTDNIYPVLVSNGASDLRVLWLEGTWTAQDNFSLAIRGTT